MTILVIVEHDKDTISSATFNTIAAANVLAGPIEALVVGDNIEHVADSVSQITSISKVLIADSHEYAHNLAENLTPLITQIAPNYTHVFAPATTFGKNIMPRVAALLDVMQISDIIEVISQDTFKRPIYAGNALATVQSSDPIKLITVRSTAFDAAEAYGGSAAIESLSGTGSLQLSEFESCELSGSERPELTSAGIVISGGRGMQDSANFAMLENVADKLGAAVGASRAAVDAGFAPNDYQVGQTGKVVAPELYMAVGISGAIQHLAGMKDSKVIVAINKDEEAPIFQVADYGLVADLFDAVPELEIKLS